MVLWIGFGFVGRVRRFGASGQMARGAVASVAMAGAARSRFVFVGRLPVVPLTIWPDHARAFAARIARIDSTRARAAA